MRKIYILCIMAIAALMMLLPACNGCEEPQVNKTPPPSKFVQKEAPKKAKVQPRTKKRDELAAKAFMDPNKKIKDIPVAQLKKELPGILSEVEKLDLRAEMQNAAEQGDFKGVFLILMESQQEICQKHGMSFEEFVAAMNKNKNDPQVKEYHKKWIASIAKQK